MPGTKAGRPFTYQSESERPRTVSVRIPRELYEELETRVKQRRTTMSEALLEGVRLWLDTPADPRDLLSSDNRNTVMQELQEQLQEMVDTAVRLALIEGRRPAIMAPEAPAPTKEEIPSYNGHTVIQGRGSKGERILHLLQSHPEGLTRNQIRAYLDTDEDVGDTLQGMQRRGKVRGEGSRTQKRYFPV